MTDRHAKLLCDGVPVGAVTIENSTTLIAGEEIILPSCQSGGTDCITLLAGVDMIILPNSCNSECEETPIDIYVWEIFECGAERLEAAVEGDGPFTYVWNIQGQNYTTSTNVFNVNPIVKLYNAGQMPYTCTVYDAVGGIGIYNGEILGTQRFYSEVIDNVKYYDYDDVSNPGFGTGYPDGYYWAGQPGVGLDAWGNIAVDRPFFIADEHNSVGPWYGATKMELEVWDGNGMSLVHYVRDLEGYDDWSFNNGEVHWNGRRDNDLSDICYCNNNTGEIMNYRVIASNCLADEEHPLEGAYIENSFLVAFSCYNWWWSTVETKSTLESDDGVIIPWRGREPFSIFTNEENSVVCYPNPSEDYLTVASTEEMLSIALFDVQGSAILKINAEATIQQIDVSLLSAGVYTVIVRTQSGEKRVKITKI